MFKNCRNWTISSEASRNGRTFTDYPVREQGKSDTFTRNNLHTIMIQRQEDKFRSGIKVVVMDLKTVTKDITGVTVIQIEMKQLSGDIVDKG